MLRFSWRDPGPLRPAGHGGGGGIPVGSGRELHDERTSAELDPLPSGTWDRPWRNPAWG